MNMNSSGITQSAVKLFVYTLQASLFAASPLFADDSKKDKSGGAEVTVTQGNNKITVPASDSSTLAEIKKMQEEEKRNLNCKEADKEYKKALEEMKSGCSKAGYQVNECQERALQCMSSEGLSDDIDPMGMVASQMGVHLGGLTSGKPCPQLSGKSYATRKDKIEEKLKKAQEQLADVKKDEADLNNDYQKDMIALNKKMTEAEKELKEKSQQMEAEDRKRFAEFQQSQNQAKEELRKVGMSLIQLRAKLNNAQAEKAVALIELTEEAAKMECDAKVAAVASKATATKANTSQNLIAQATANKKRRLAVWNSCIEGFQEKRKAMLEGKKSEQEAILTEIRNTESRGDEIQNMLNLSSTQLEQVKQADLVAKSDAQQNLIKLGQEVQNEMSAAYTKLQQTQQSFNLKSANFQNQINMANMELQKLMAKGEPPEESESSIVQAANTISGSADAIFEIESNSEYELCPFMQTGKGNKASIRKTSKKLAPHRTSESGTK